MTLAKVSSSKAFHHSSLFPRVQRAGKGQAIYTSYSVVRIIQSLHQNAKGEGSSIKPFSS
jgi:hypothetical protein